MTKNTTLPPQPMSRELMGKIVDEVFGGAIEDASVIEEIHAVIRQHHIDAGIAAILADDTPATEADRVSILECDLGITKGRNAMLAKALQLSLDIMLAYKRLGYGDDVYMMTLCQAIQGAERALTLHAVEAVPPSSRGMGDNQPRYNTKRMHDEIAKARAYGLEMAASLAIERAAEYDATFENSNYKTETLAAIAALVAIAAKIREQIDQERSAAPRAMGDKIATVTIPVTMAQVIVGALDSATFDDQSTQVSAGVGKRCLENEIRHTSVDKACGDRGEDGQAS